MQAHIQFETGIDATYVEAAELAYQYLGHAANEPVAVHAKPLALSLPTLATGQIDSEWIEHVSAEADTSFLVITKRDLGAAGLNFCFGRSVFGERAVIISTHRIDEVTMAGLALHELGHSVGLVPESASRYNRLSRFAGHCSNSCVMEPLRDLQEVCETVSKVAARPHSAGFCAECVRDIARNL